MRTLIVQIKCKPGTTYDVAAAIIDDIQEGQIYSVSGAYDLLAIFTLGAGIDPGVFINKRVHTIANIVDTNTTIAFNAFTPSNKPSALKPSPASSTSPPASARCTCTLTPASFSALC